MKDYQMHVLGRMGEVYMAFAVSDRDLKGDTHALAKETLKILEISNGSMHSWRKKTYKGKPCFDFAFQIIGSYPSSGLGRAVDAGNHRFIVILAYGDRDFAADPKAIRCVDSLSL
ncbi:MAG: hypothetical protein U0984_10985 [Prosthecobacter sp.]|nr:hypothetical protein [Prosthecobacter sp.]